MRIRHTFVRTGAIGNAGIGAFLLFRAFTEAPHSDQFISGAVITWTASAALFGLDLICEMVSKPEKKENDRQDSE